jgi:hypothetical protein
MAAAALAIAVAGCGGNEGPAVSTSSTCREFMAAGFEARTQLYERTAGSGYWPAVEDVMLVCDAFPAAAVAEAMARASDG